MASIGRFLVNNLILAGGAIVPDSFQSTYPTTYLRDQLRSKPWRSKDGWTFTAENCVVPGFGSIVLGNYPTGEEAAAAVAATGLGITYNPSTFRFTTTSGVNWVATNSAGKSLGFTQNYGAGATSEYPVNQSEHSLKIDLVSAQEITVAAILNHNVSSAGTVRFQCNDSDSWANPVFNQVLDKDVHIAIAFFAAQTKRYMRLLIEDYTNPVAYAQVGIWYAGTYLQPNPYLMDGYGNTPEELSDIQFALGGSHYFMERARRQTPKLRWVAYNQTDLDLMEDIADATPKGKNFLFAFDAVLNPKNTKYCFRTGSLEYSLNENTTFIELPMAEALG